MKISIKNLGPIKQAEFELGELTIICGENNTGKTYATYALYGFLDFWRNSFVIDVPNKDIKRLLSEGSIVLDVQYYIDHAQSILNHACEDFTSQMPHRVFASSYNNFTESHFFITFDQNEIRPIPSFVHTMGATKTQLLSMSKKADSPLLTVSLLVAKGTIQHDFINIIIGAALRDIVFGYLFPSPFIASAERTGAAIFRKELDFARNRLLEKMNSKENDINPLQLFSDVYTDYAIPVKSNVDFTRQLESISKNDSFISTKYPEILCEFSDILGGNFVIAENDMLYFVPSGTQLKLTMGESSSAVRSLLTLRFYLHHVAKKGDLLIIDEPELNLHPENQRRMARLFARLANIGIKVFITTHSDYIIKELNTLIMLNQGGERLNKLAEDEGYKAAELLNADKVKVYVAENSTLVPADIDPEYGVEVTSFDKSIDDMNRIQKEIVWGGDE